jgi:RNA chaperone Hfq
MKKKRAVPVEAQTLSRWQQDSVRLKLSLVNGVVLEGRLAGHDQYMLLLEDAGTRAVYKHAVLRIEPKPAGAGSRPPSPGTVTVRTRRRRP